MENKAITLGLQEICLEILLDVQAVCDKYNLTIMLGGGSALGAVRHQGFIPWDDDIDLNMLRGDFEKFKLIFKKELGKKYNLYAPNYSENKAIERFAKIEKKHTTITTLIDTNDIEEKGICIDIFIIDKIPSNKILRLMHGFASTVLMMIAANVLFYERINANYKLYFIRNNNCRYLLYYSKVLVGYIFHFKRSYNWFNTLDKVLWYKGKTDMCGVPTGRKHYFGEIFKMEVYIPVQEAKFEDNKVYLPNKIDKYLTNLYGNYMVIPDNNERVSHNIIDFTIND